MRNGATPNGKARGNSAPTAGLLYRPLDFVMFRAPLLPVERYLDLAGVDGGKAFCPMEQATTDRRVQSALAVGSPSLHAALHRDGKRSAQRRLESKLLRYLIRMSTRPTPYGLFAGAALAYWGDSTNLEISARQPATRTRPDMDWLMRLVLDLETRPEIRQQLRLFANPEGFVRAGRLFLSERASNGQPAQSVSVRASPVVMETLRIARQPISHRELVDRLLAAFPTASELRVESLITELCQQTFLLTDLRPPMTVPAPAQHVVERLSGTDPGQALESIIQAAAGWDALPIEERAGAHPRLLRQVTDLKQSPPEEALQVDMELPLSGHRINREVALEVCRAAQLLLQLSPQPHGVTHIQAYRDGFLARYGDEREVPLLELLDPNFGLGPVTNFYNRPASTQNAHRFQQRNQALLQLAWDAARCGSAVVELDADLIARLETWQPNVGTAPLSLDVYAFVGAQNSAALDRGDFRVVIGPNVGADAAGRNLGRFADLLGPAAESALRAAALAEQSFGPKRSWAELAYLPSNLRSANVAVRPSVRPYELNLGVSPGLPRSSVIPLDEVVVGVSQGRLYVRWLGSRDELVACSGHMLNSSRAPQIARFLVDLARANTPLLAGFDWGPAYGLPFLPRVQSGRAVLQPAEWRIERSSGRGLAAEDRQGFLGALDRWREEMRVPRHVHLGWGDNRLMLDLEDGSQVEELRTELGKVPQGGHLIVQEILPTLDEVWAPGPGGHYVSEVVVSMVLRNELTNGTETKPVLLPVRLPSPASTRRWRPPGSEWLYLKLYCPDPLQEDLLTGPVASLAERVTRLGLATNWFFIRYSDPDTHLRLRFKGRPQTLTGEVMPMVCRWANRLLAQGLCTKFVFDTYEREVERFGGAAAVGTAETAFWADSRACIRLLELIRQQPGLDRGWLAILSADHLLEGFGLDSKARLSWCRAHVTGRHEVSAEYRERKEALRRLIGFSALTGVPDGVLEAIFADLRSDLLPVVKGIARLASRGRLGQEPGSLWSVLLHLHFNRLGVIDAAWERRILGLLLRTRESLDRAPLRPDPASATALVTER